MDVALDHIATVDARATAVESATGIDDLNRAFIQPAAAALAEKINADGLALYADVPYCCGTAGTTPGELADLAAARRALNVQKAPASSRVAVWDPEADAKFTQLAALVNAEKAGSSQALREGAIGRVYGMDNYMSQAVRQHATGITAATAVKVNGVVTAGARQLSIDGTALTGRLVKELNYTLDIFAQSPAEAGGIAAKADERMRGAGFRRESAADFFESDAQICRVSLRYRALADTAGNVYQ